MADRTRISELLSRYYWAYDQGDLEQVADCLHDAVVLSGTFPGGGTIGPFEGKAAVLEYLGKGVANRTDVRRHLVSNVLLEEDAQANATVISYVTSLVVRDGTPVFVSAGWCRDRVLFDSSKWRFAERRMTFDAVPG